MGRDKSIVLTHPNCTKETVRIIIDAEVPLSNVFKFDLKPSKVFLFNKETEVRLREDDVKED
jgi:hypothetical protein